MTKTLTPQLPATPKITPETMEKVLIQGDLKALTPLERVTYYDALCRSLGLNSLAKPFDYLLLNGKLTLYARRECTEQLRRIHGVNLTIKSREVQEGCYIVHVTATLPDGRQDESIGVTSLEGLKGENRANALMKAESKAKRRVTLSICGLAFMDQSEVDSVRGASHVAIDPQTGEASSPDPQLTRTVPPADIVPEAKTLLRQEATERPWRKFGEMIDEFAKLRGRLGHDHDGVYGEVLERFGVRHSNEFKDFRQAAAAYQQLLRRVLQLEAAAADESAMIDAAEMLEEIQPPEEEATA